MMGLDAHYVINLDDGLLNKGEEENMRCRSMRVWTGAWYRAYERKT